VAQPPDEDVPVGKDETENVEISRWGDIRKFDFEPKDHIQLGMALDIIDIERAVRLAGARNYFLKGAGAILHWAVLRFAMDFMIQKGYVPFSVPMLMRNEVMVGTGFFPGSEEQTYRMERDELNLAGTAEVPLTAYFMGEIIPQEILPQKFVGLSTCYRREAGAAGKDTYGLYRIHQFDKVEQVVICENSVEQSAKFHEEIRANAEAVMQTIGIPYRVVKVCTGDLGRGQAKKYDIEAWMPSRNNFGETHSASKFYDFQARRLNLRYKDIKTKKNLFCHTLNNTVIASPRILIPILELNQNKDGSINIPKVLRPYMNGMERITK
jgi:seryl-tRNA synthetase